MKRVFMVHGWGGNPEEGGFPWLKKELEKKRFEAFFPMMPEPLNPKIETWVDFLSEQIGIPDKETYLIGHSIGVQAILRYLEKLPESIEIGGAVFLAGWVNLNDEAFESEGDDLIAKPWLETPIDWEEVKSHTNKFTAIFSDNDPFVPLSDSNIFKEKLGVKIVIEKEKGHFSGSDGIMELPSVLKAVLEMIE